MAGGEEWEDRKAAGQIVHGLWGCCRTWAFSLSEAESWRAAKQKRRL